MIEHSGDRYSRMLDLQRVRLEILCTWVSNVNCVKNVLWFFRRNVHAAVFHHLTVLEFHVNEEKARNIAKHMPLLL